MVKNKLKLKDSLKNVRAEKAGKKEKAEKKKIVKEQEESEEEEEGLGKDALKIIEKIENGDDKPMSHKEQRKLKKVLKQVTEESDEEEDSDEEEVPELLNTDRLVESDSEGEHEDLGNNNQDSEEEDDEEEEEDVPLSDVELDDDADVVPYQKVTVNKPQALSQSLSNIQLPYSQMKFSEHLRITSSTPLVLRDVFDDLERELAFYQQGLSAVKEARSLLAKEPGSTLFSRPTDYFAEMLKSDEHMDLLKQKLVEQETAKRASQDARKLRELKKFGKQVQHEKLQARALEKRDTLDRIKSLKRKRKGNEMSAEEFDIAVEEAAAEVGDRKSNRSNKPNAKRVAKNAKYGNGGRKRFSRSNTAESSNDMSGFSNKKNKTGFSGKAKRPGKSKRAKHF